MIRKIQKTYYVCKCDNCGKVSEPIEKSPEIYNAAQAARSIGWSFGKTGKVFCKDCRLFNYNDRHINRYALMHERFCSQSDTTLP